MIHERLLDEIHAYKKEHHGDSPTEVVLYQDEVADFMHNLPKEYLPPMKDLASLTYPDGMKFCGVTLRVKRRDVA